MVYSTSTTGLSTLTFRGEVVASGGGVEERSEVMYWHRGAYIIYYTKHNMSQLYSVTDGGLRPRVYDYIIIRNTACMTKIGVSGGLRAAKGGSEVSLGSVDRGGSCWW